jgi:hypothetical protein
VTRESTGLRGAWNKDRRYVVTSDSTVSKGDFSDTEGDFSDTEGELSNTVGELSGMEGEFSDTEGDCDLVIQLLSRLNL